MRKKLFIFPVVFVIACFLLFLIGGCASDDPPAGDEVENGGAEAPPPGSAAGEEEEEEEEWGNSAGNILNGGLVAQQGDKIYFANSGDGSKLYRASLDGSGKTKLVEDRAQYINATERHLYYVAMGERETIYSELMGEEFIREVYGPIVRVNLEGGERTVICADPAANLQLAGGKLYYQLANTDEPKIYRIETDGSDQKLLTAGRADYFCVADSGLYFRGIAERPQLYRASLDGGGQSLFYDGDAYFPNLLGDHLYFIGDIIEAGAYLGGRSLYRISTAGGEAIKVGEVEPALLNCAGEWLYYSQAYSGDLCRIRPDGSGNEVLSSDPCGGIFVFAHGLYYVNIDEQGSLYYLGLDGGGRQKIN